MPSGIFKKKDPGNDPGDGGPQNVSGKAGVLREV